MQFNVNNFTVLSCYNRTFIEKGGSMILVRNNILAKERKDIVQLSIEHQVELSCIEMSKYIILCVYRPSGQDFNIFEKTMEEVLKLLFDTKKQIIVCGDFNVDLLEKSIMHTKLIHLFKSFNLSNVFLEPTRITQDTATCLDNIFCDCEYLNNKVINCLQSDHSGQTITFIQNTTKKPKDVFCRPITNQKMECFKLNLKVKLPNFNLLQEDPNALFTDLFNIVLEEFDNMFKLKKVSNDSKITFSDWATPGIYKSRKHLYELYDIKSYNHDVQFIEYLKLYSRLFKLVCLKAKCLYLNKKLKMADNKVKAVWKIINTETGKNKKRDRELKLNFNNEVVIGDKSVANAFERFFTDIPSLTTKDLDSSPELAYDLLKEHVPHCDSVFAFRHVNPFTVIKVFKSLNLKKTEDLWGQSVKVISSVIDLIAPHLALIFNKCIDDGVFPDLMKLSKLVPLFKSGDNEDPSSYRPVSVLPVLSKVFEKIVLNQLLSHFHYNKLLHSEQYGFTRGKSTTDAGVALVKHIFDAWEEKQDAFGVFCDLSKAFDCVNHEILLRKLDFYGIKGKSLAFLKSYLSDRIQKVDINRVKSPGSLIKMGVPQGSILGPLLFLIYINDLPYLVKTLSEIVLFADDTSLIFKVNRHKDNLDDTNVTLSRVLDWFTANNLVLNAKKTKCIKFTLPNVLQVNVDLLLDGSKLELVNQTKFLGITIDAKLQWGPHIEALCGRLSSAAYAVRRIRQITDVDTARLVYFSYFHSIMSYGLLLWGRAADVDAVFVLQKRAIRAIYNMKHRDSLREKFKEINILTLPCEFIYQVIRYVRKNIETFPRLGGHHTIETRNKHKLAFPKVRLGKVSTSFVGHGIRFYNKLPKEVLAFPENKFKLYIKQGLLKKAYYKINDYLEDEVAWC